MAATLSSNAQLYDSSRLFHVFENDVISAEDTGVALDALFEFDHDMGYLKITLNNLSGTPKPGGGSYTDGILVGFGFDGPSGLLYKSNSFIELSESAGEPYGVNFTLGNGFSMSGDLGGSGNGSFNFGAGVAGANGNGGGDPKDGIAGGHSATFRFRFKGDLSNFNAYDFFAENGSDADLGFRFRAVGDCAEDSDKLVYFVDDCPPEAPPIPEPSTYGLMAAGLLVGISAFKRYRGRQLAASR
jgi:hypothetical protein